MSKELLQQALDALLNSTPKPIANANADDYCERGWKEREDAITALRSALAAPQPEPVAWRIKPMVSQSFWQLSDDGYYASCKRDQGYIVESLYAAPPAAPAPAENFCYCNEEISLQMVSGGAANEGLYGRVTLLIDGKYVDYVRAESAAPAVREPLTPDVMWLLWSKACEKPQLTRDLVCDFARAIEQAHGIGGGGK